MEITVSLPEQTVRKIRAFAILCGGGNNLEELLVNMIDDTLSGAIIGAVGGEPSAFAQPAPGRPEPQAQTFWGGAQYVPAQVSPLVDHSGISNGLGDDDLIEDDGGTDDAMAFVPENGAGGVSGEDIDRDMEVDDPQHEAKVEAPPVDARRNGEPERLFADMANMPEPPTASRPDPRADRRRKPLKSRARVTGFTGNESSTF
jgi:hypothetical protein